MKKIEVQGHRGCRGLLPENTMAAFTRAVALGVDVVELDLALSKDKVLVVSHDPRVNPQICKGGEKLPTNRIKDLTWEQLQTLDCGALKHPRYPDQAPAPGERMPRLEQVLKLLLNNQQLRLNIEIKTFPDAPEDTFAPPEFARHLVTLLKEQGMGKRVVVQSFDPAALQEVARLDPSLELAALADKRKDFDALLTATGARILSPRYTELRKEDISRFHRKGVRIIPWTVNKPPDMRRLMQWGVDGIITDRPDRLLQILKR